jgi:copper chaperone CopZ
MSTKITIVGLGACAVLLLASAACKRGNKKASAESPDEKPAEQKTSKAATTKRQGSTAKASEKSSASSSERTADETAECELAVEGMVCQGCAKNIEKTLGAKSGVVSVEASFQDKNANISYNPEKISSEKIENIVDGIEQPDLKAKLVKSSEAK